MHGEDRPNIKTQLIIGALKFAQFPEHISIDYGASKFFLIADTQMRHKNLLRCL